jgi:hypothetical protein
MPLLAPGGTSRSRRRPRIARLELGYADQAHFIRDFKRLVGRGHGLASASRFRKAASPASDTSTHFAAGEASAS